jgi:hypothetical protein
LAAQEEDVDDGQGQVPQSLEQIEEWMKAGGKSLASGVGTDERVDSLVDDETEVLKERLKAQARGESTGWSSRANWSSLTDEESLIAPPGTTDEEMLQHLRCNYDPDELTMLETIDVSNTQITDIAAIHIISKCPRLIIIYLLGTKVTDKTATAVVIACPNLYSIDLEKTQVTRSLAKSWTNTSSAKVKQHTSYGGTIADFHKKLRHVTDKKKDEEAAAQARERNAERNRKKRQAKKRLKAASSHIPPNA